MGTHLPDSQESNEEVLGETGEQHLREDKHVGREGTLEHDGHVGRVKESHGERPALSSVLAALDRDLDAESL
jgi:hypothetical protein